MVGEIHNEGDPGVPWDFDDLEITKLRSEQPEMEKYEQGVQGQADYVIDDGLLYTLRPPSGKTAYPRLVLLPSAHFRVIRRAHHEVGHQGMWKTLERLQENNKWPGQCQDTYDVIKKCARCQVNAGKQERPPPEFMPVSQVSNIGFIMVHGLNEGHIAPACGPVSMPNYWHGPDRTSCSLSQWE